MSSPKLSAALEIITAYYRNHTAVMRALVERGFTLSSEAVVHPASKAGWPRQLSPRTLDLIGHARRDMATLILLKHEIESPKAKRVIHGDEIVAHAHRILTVWRMELTHIADPSQLVRLLQFDTDYLYMTGFAHSLLQLRWSGTTKLDPTTRREIADGVQALFLPGTEHSGVMPKGPPPRDLHAEYQTIVGELRSPTPERDISSVPLTKLGAYLFGEYPESYKKSIRVPCTHKDLQQRTLQHFVFVRPGEQRELRGLEKVLAYCFPDVHVGVDQKGIIFPDPRAETERTSPDGKYRAPERWKSLRFHLDGTDKEEHHSRQALHRLLDQWSAVLGWAFGVKSAKASERKRRSPGEAAKLILACVYGFGKGGVGTETVDRAASSRFDFTPELIKTVTQLDDRRDWAHISTQASGVRFLLGTFAKTYSVSLEQLKAIA